jgi:hypothetical protein
MTADSKQFLSNFRSWASDHVFSGILLTLMKELIEKSILQAKKIASVLERNAN